MPVNVHIVLQRRCSQRSGPSFLEMELFRTHCASWRHWPSELDFHQIYYLRITHLHYCVVTVSCFQSVDLFRRDVYNSSDMPKSSGLYSNAFGGSFTPTLHSYMSIFKRVQAVHCLSRLWYVQQRSATRRFHSPPKQLQSPLHNSIISPVPCFSPLPPQTIIQLLTYVATYRHPGYDVCVCVCVAVSSQMEYNNLNGLCLSDNLIYSSVWNFRPTVI